MVKSNFFKPSKNKKKTVKKEDGLWFFSYEQESKRPRYLFRVYEYEIYAKQIISCPQESVT